MYSNKMTKRLLILTVAVSDEGGHFIWPCKNLTRSLWEHQVDLNDDTHPTVRSKQDDSESSRVKHDLT